MTNKYFIGYIGTNKNNSLTIGNCDLDTEGFIIEMDNVLKLESMLTDKYNFLSCKIMSFSKYDSINESEVKNDTERKEIV